MANSGPHLPSVAELETAAGDLLVAYERGDAEARDRVEFASAWLATIPAKLWTLQHAQLTIAREHDFSDWRTLCRYAAELHAPAAERALAFVQSICSSRPELAQRLLDADHRLAEADIFTAAVSGHVEAVRTFLNNNPLLAKMSGGPGDRTPLSYLCFSRYLALDEARQLKLIEIAQLLLDAGADPNAYYMVNADPNARQTCLYGAAGVNNVPALTRMLLAAGADPNDAAPGLGPESLYHASEFHELDCLRLILEARPHADKVSYCLGRKLDFEHPAGVQLFLQFGADPNFTTPWGEHQTRLHGAIVRGRSLQIIRMLLNAGANLTAKVQSGRTPYAWAIRWGRTDVAELLLESGASESEASDVDRFLCACIEADEATARSLLIQYPDLVTGLTPGEKGSLAQAAYDDNLPAVKLMVELGFPIEAKGDFGTAVNQAAWRGNAEVVEYLIEKGANLETLNNFQGTALDCCVFGASNCEEATTGNVPGVRQLHPGEYVRCVEALIAAGADLTKVSPFPSGNREIDDLLRRHGRVD